MGWGPRVTFGRPWRGPCVVFLTLRGMPKAQDWATSWSLRKTVIACKGRCFRDNCPRAGSAVPAEADPQMSGGPRQL